MFKIKAGNKPLNKEELHAMVMLAQNGNAGMRSKVMEEMLHVVEKKIHKGGKDLLPEDVYDCCIDSILSAINTFNPEKGDFECWFYIKLKGAVKEFRTKHRRMPTVEIWDTMDEECELFVQEREQRDTIDYCMSFLDGETQKVLTLKHGLDGCEPHTFAQIDETMNLTSGRAAFLTRRAMKVLRGNDTLVRELEW